jgi:hypothetical protein
MESSADDVQLRCQPETRDSLRLSRVFEGHMDCTTGHGRVVGAGAFAANNDDFVTFVNDLLVSHRR